MPSDRYGRRRRGLGGLATMLGAVVAAAVMTVSATAGGLSDVVVVRGELERLERQAYDYLYRNSNRNVFRRSRHYHPTQNVFRSSQYYQRRLAASFSGYPLRTTYRDGHRGRDGRGRHGGRRSDESYVHPRTSPYGPSPDGVWYEQGDDALARAAAERAIQGSASVGTARLVRPRPRARWEMETVPVRIVERPSTQRAVLRTVHAADGTIRTVITNDAAPVTPDPPATIDGAWTRLARGEHAAAAALFAQLSLESDDDAAAVVGYALARAAAGDGAAAAAALRRAVAAGPETLASVGGASFGPGLLDEIERRYAPTGDDSADADHTLILSTIRALRREPDAARAAAAPIGG